MVFVVFHYVRAVSTGALDWSADAIANPGTLPYPTVGSSRKLKIISTDVKGQWGENQKVLLQQKCECLWPLWVLATLMMKGFIRIDGRAVFQDKELYGSAWILMFKLLGQWNKGIAQSELAKEYIFDNFAGVLQFAFISPEEATEKKSFASCTIPLNLPKPCNPLPASSCVFLCFDVFL